MEKNRTHFSYRERLAVEEHVRLSPHLVYEIIRRNGVEELRRPKRALVFSGIIAGIVITFSFVFKAVFTACLPAASWTPLLSNLGYTVGFLLVILGHMQLFTENTITTVVPMFNPVRLRKLLALLRLWGIVLLSNLIGTTLAAWFLLNPYVINPEFVTALDDIAHHAASFSSQENLWRGIPSGILIASIVWMMPGSKHFAFLLIMFFTYLIALGDFTHIVVGSAEMAYWVMKGNADLYDYFVRFLIPTGVGNIIGGTVIFTLLIYVQAVEELKRRSLRSEDAD